jgi:hypothetical protein
MARTANICHLVFLRELPQVGDPFFPAAAREMVVRPWHSRRVLAKSAVSGDPVFTSMDTLMYGP